MFVIYVSRWRSRLMKCLRLLLVLVLLAVLGGQLLEAFKGHASAGGRNNPVRMEEQKGTPASGFPPEINHNHPLNHLWRILEQYYRGR